MSEEFESLHTPRVGGVTFVPNVPKQLLTASEIATEAARLVGGDREVTHGNKTTNFNNIAALWTAWLKINHNLSGPLLGSDVAKMMALLKLVRMETGTLNVDDAIDTCGYGAIAGELAAAE